MQLHRVPHLKKKGMKTMKKATITITYYNDYERELKTVPVWEAPEELLDPQATTEDLREMHSKMRADREEYDRYLDQMDWE